LDFFGANSPHSFSVMLSPAGGFVYEDGRLWPGGLPSSPTFLVSRSPMERAHPARQASTQNILNTSLHNTLAKHQAEKLSGALLYGIDV